MGVGPIDREASVGAIAKAQAIHQIAVFFLAKPTGQRDVLRMDDPEMLWAEEVLGETALKWVRAQNERTLAALQQDQRYQILQRQALDILTSKERIPYGRVRDGKVYNFWQDETHVRGIWRRCSLEEYKKEAPDWESILDFDRLAEEENRNWVFSGANVHRCSGTSQFKCLISLSDGGKDAVVNREFDLEEKCFTTGGFETSEAKQNLAWIDADTLLIGTDWGEGSLTESGYPMILKRWQRGTPLQQAQEVIRGQKSDVAVHPMTIELDDGTMLECAIEADTFFTSTCWLLRGDQDPVQWPIPPKCSISGRFRDWLFILLKQDWQPESTNQSFRSGDLVAFRISEFLHSLQLPSVQLVFRPDATQAVNGVSVSRDAALLSINENVSSKLLRLYDEPRWHTKEIELPGKGTANVVFSDKDESIVFLGYDDFLTPDSLLDFDSSSNRVTSLKTIPAKFDTQGLKVEQHFAKSKDGTLVPYFLVSRENLPMDGSTPTLLYGYGGFQISQRPGYRPVTGKLWLEKGGAYALANIRGGGEFGPDWHQSGLKTRRQVVYDDFIAIGEDLIQRQVTSPEHLGIMGGSNGGLLMGVMLNQRPDLWNAVVVQVPLLDMLRYHLLLAGASWVDEYGSPEVAAERAFLEKISPVHNFHPEAKEYPTPLFVTSTKDDRVHPGHARKMAALFEQASLPFFYYENIDGGHSAAANQIERARRTALEFTYLMKMLM